MRRRFPKSLRKYIAREKSRLRRKFSDPSQAKQAILKMIDELEMRYISRSRKNKIDYEEKAKEAISQAFAQKEDEAKKA